MTQTHLPPPSVARMLVLADQRQQPTARIARQPGPVIRHDGADDTSITGVHTALLTLTPAFLDALRKVAPKKRRAKIRYVVMLAVLAVLVVLGADASAREFGIAKGRELAGRLHRAPAAKSVDAPGATALAQAVTPADAPPAIGAPFVKVDEPAFAPVVVNTPPAKKSTKTSPAARPKKSAPLPAARQMLAAQISTRRGR